MKRVIISGSPRANGRSAHLAEMLFEVNIDERPQDELFLVPVSEVDVAPCIGCNGCRQKSAVIYTGDDGAERTEMRHRCVFDDDMQTVYDLLDDADELSIVAPVYFSGAPAQLKCLLDRLQPYFWAREGRGGSNVLEKRPATLHVVGEGGDPYGFDPLASEVASALACAGFRLERVLSWVGKITDEGDITGDAEELVVAQRRGALLRAAEAADAVSGDADSAVETAVDGAARGSQGETRGGSGAGRPAKAARPKLDLSASRPSRQGGQQAKRGHGGSGARGDGGKPGGGKPDGGKPGGGKQSGKQSGKRSSGTSAKRASGAAAKRGRRG